MLSLPVIGSWACTQHYALNRHYKNTCHEIQSKLLRFSFGFFQEQTVEGL